MRTSFVLFPNRIQKTDVVQPSDGREGQADEAGVTYFLFGVFRDASVLVAGRQGDRGARGDPRAERQDCASHLLRP